MEMNNSFVIRTLYEMSLARSLRNAQQRPPDFLLFHYSKKKMSANKSNSQYILSFRCKFKIHYQNFI